MPHPDEIPEEEADLAGYRRKTQEDIEAEEALAEKLKFRREMLLAYMRNETFREWMMEKLVSFRTFHNPFGQSETGFPDPLATQFALGMKAAGWALWEELDGLAPDLASMMRRGV